MDFLSYWLVLAGAAAFIAWIVLRKKPADPAPVQLSDEQKAQRAADAKAALERKRAADL